MQKEQTGTAEIGLESTRIKGASYIQIYKNVANETLLLSDGSFVKENDLLQISYTALGKEYGTIFSIDGNGAVTLHFPQSEYDSAQLEKNGETALSWSYRLDNAPEYEKFYFVTSAIDFSVENVLSYAHTLAESSKNTQLNHLDLPAGYDQYTITLKKGDK